MFRMILDYLLCLFRCFRSKDLNSHLKRRPAIIGEKAIRPITRALFMYRSSAGFRDMKKFQKLSALITKTITMASKATKTMKIVFFMALYFSRFICFLKSFLVGKLYHIIKV